MKARLVIILLCGLSFSACARDTGETETETQPRRIISLDFCADQYLLMLADPGDILGLSTDSDKPFSYLRNEAPAFRQIRPRAEDILIERPSAVIRTYGGGPNVTAFLERVGVDVIQIAYADDLAGIRSNIINTAAALGEPARGEAVAAEMDRRLAAIDADPKGAILYLTSKGAVAGGDTLIDELMRRAGRENFERRKGWGFAPLERLAYETPDAVAAGFFDAADARTDRWSPARHPVAQRSLHGSQVIDIPGAWTACAAWQVVDAAEAMAAAR